MAKDHLSWEVFSQEKSWAPPSSSSNQKQREAALRLLHTAMGRELTSRQRQCVELCVLRGMTQQQAGRLLGVTKPPCAATCKNPSAGWPRQPSTPPWERAGKAQGRSRCSQWESMV